MTYHHVINFPLGTSPYPERSLVIPVISKLTLGFLVDLAYVVESIPAP